MGKECTLTNKLKSIGLTVYFIVLFCERLLAVIFSIDTGGEYAVKTGNYFNFITYSVTVISLIAGVVLSVKPLSGLLKKLFSKDRYSFE